MATLGERLKKLRESRSLTQDELAEALGVSKQAVSQYERGVRRPDYETLSAICDLFNVSSDFLLGNSNRTTRLLDENQLSLVGEFYTFVRQVPNARVCVLFCRSFRRTM